ncbi:MAG: hypothetical protein CSA63_00235 [Propionibacterium sp.]|nr:MAG: hypothetical protein CSA63_00235 [Propionibacterium sp.]
MSNIDIGSILDDLAAGVIDVETASQRIEELKRQQPASADEQPAPNPSGLERLSVTAVGRRVKIQADSSVATLTVEGQHVLRRSGTVMEVSSAGDLGPSFEGFSFVRPPRSLDDLRDISWGKELVIRVNPELIVDVELTTGVLRCLDVPQLGRIRVTGSSCTLAGAREVADLLGQASSVSVTGPLSRGRSKLRVESGSLNIILAPGSNVTVRGETKLGRINWPDDGEHVDEYAVGNGSARLDISVLMGLANIKVEE